MGRHKIFLPYRARRMLGTVPDRVVAEMVGCSNATIVSARNGLGIAPCRDQGVSRWTAEAEALLGTLADREVAERLGLPFSAVFNRRRQLGIPPCYPRDGPKPWHKSTLWEPEPLQADLATMRDADIAAKYGFSRERARQLRVRFAIPAPPEPLPRPSKTMTPLARAGKGYRVRCRCGREYEAPVVSDRLCGHCPHQTTAKDAERVGKRPHSDSRLVAVRPDLTDRRYWFFDCDCGTKDVRCIYGNAQRGGVKSCGCVRKEYASFLRRKMGEFWHMEPK